LVQVSPLYGCGALGAPSKNYLLDYGWMITVWNSGRSALTRRVDEWWRLSFGIEAAP